MSQQRGLRPLDPIFSPGKRLGQIAVGNSPPDTPPPDPGGGPAPDVIRFTWNGLVNFLRSTPTWRVMTAASLAEVDVDMPETSAAINYTILKNGSSAGTFTTTATSAQTVSITPVSVAHGDKIRLQITSVGSGACNSLSVVLREAD